MMMDLTVFTLRVRDPRTKLTMEWNGKSAVHLTYAVRCKTVTEAHQAFGSPDRIFFDLAEITHPVSWVEEKE